MKRETVIGLVLLTLFVAFAVVGGETAHWIIYMFGCFAVGWKIPDSAEFVDRILFRRKNV